MEELSVTANGIDFECLRAGDGDRLALCLHGFPDDAGTFDDLLGELADEGYTAVAPYMRGYAPTASAPEDDYSAGALGSDAVALARELPGTDPVCIGHDWGAIASYAAARTDPGAFDAMVTMAVPPRFAERVFEDPAQLARSWYIWFIQLEGMAEYAIRRDDFAFFDYLWSTWSPGWDWDPERLAAVKETFGTGDTLDNALSYYRQLVGPVATDGGGGIQVPALVIGGEEDGCIGVEFFDDLEDGFAAPVECQIVPDAGHFMHRERPVEITDTILSFLEAH